VFRKCVYQTAQEVNPGDRVIAILAQRLAWRKFELESFIVCTVSSANSINAVESTVTL
jgi:hypothetical protein